MKLCLALTFTNERRFVASGRFPQKVMLLVETLITFPLRLALC